ncbi:ubiquitin carboxyl-terminal hydrolase 4-like [Anolis carolinensis]|uniref:ubiquitin carboxyl-terminal hydrolase 4-like n=1 Tax=Anolis carolinensis TaxID=28377 RepID=UPI002F2B401C
MATRKQRKGAGEIEVYQEEESSDSEQQTTMSEAMMKYQLEMKKLELEAQMEKMKLEKEAEDKEKQRQAQIELKKMAIEWERQKLTLSQPSVVAQPGTPSDLALKRFSKYTKEDVEMQRIELAPLLKMPLCPGDSWCLIDYKWFKKWQRYVGFESWDLYYARKPDYYPGPIDNSKLFEDSETQTLKKYRMNGVDYEVIPIEAWNKLVNWYDCIEGQRPIERTVVEYGKYFKCCKVEVYLLESKPSQNNDSVNFVSSQFKQAKDSAEDGGIINLQEKLSESQLETHCVAEVNVSPVAEVSIQCHSDTGIEQAEVIGNLEVPVIDENDLLEHSKEMNIGIRSQKLEEDGSCSGQTLQIKSNTTKGRSLDASSQSSTDSICSVVTSLVTAITEHGQQVWPEENLPQETTKFDPVELLCTGEPKGPTNTPKKMDILSLRVIANRNELRSKWILVFN